MQEVLQNGEQVGHAVRGLAVALALDDARLAVARPGGRLVEQAPEAGGRHAGVAAQSAGAAETRTRRVVAQLGAQSGDLGPERVAVLVLGHDHARELRPLGALVVGRRAETRVCGIGGVGGIESTSKFSISIGFTRGEESFAPAARDPSPLPASADCFAYNGLCSSCGTTAAVERAGGASSAGNRPSRRARPSTAAKNGRRLSAFVDWRPCVESGEGSPGWHYT